MTDTEWSHRRLLHRRMALAGAEARASFVIAALMGIHQASRPLGKGLSSDVNRALTRALEIREKVRARLVTLPLLPKGAPSTARNAPNP